MKPLKTHQAEAAAFAQRARLRQQARRGIRTAQLLRGGAARGSRGWLALASIATERYYTAAMSGSPDVERLRSQAREVLHRLGLLSAVHIASVNREGIDADVAWILGLGQRAAAHDRRRHT